MTDIKVENIPAQLREVPQWVVWGETVRNGKPDKPPLDYRSGRPGDVRDPAIWLPFERAIVEAKRFGGLGFAFAPNDSFAGIDLDHCFDDAGNLEPWAERVVDGMQSATERSPSGRGLHVYVKGRLPVDCKHKRTGFGADRRGSIELYDRARYFTVTGDYWPGTPKAVEDRGEELAAFYRELFPEEAAQRNGHTPVGGGCTLDDEAILALARGPFNGPRFRALFDRGDTSRFDGDHSRADLALCADLAFYARKDPETIDRLFRRSALMRPKWDERRGKQTYGERTIARAVEGSGSYDPGDEADADEDGGTAAGREGGKYDPHRLAGVFLARQLRSADGPTLLYWNQEWHRWDGQAWRAMPEFEIRAQLTGGIKAECDRLATESGRRPKAVTTSLVTNVLQALRHLALLRLADCPRQPAWIGPREPGEDLPDPREVLPASNALIHLPAFAEGEPYTLALSPRFFSPTTLGYPFDPVTAGPRRWLDFLGELWPDDPESIESLQEWFGYLLVPDTSQQKILLLIGPKRSGKGTIARVLRALVGPENVAAPTLSGLTTPFGLQPLIGKTVAVVADARLSGRADATVIVERLLSISGEDAQTIDRKHLASWHGSLPTRFVLVSNELPRLGDASGAMPSRVVLLRLTQSFYGREDTALTERLLAERPAILRWAIAGWTRLRSRGHFLQPASGRELLDDLDELSSPVGAFVAERCRTGPECRSEAREVFNAWKQWCSDNGRDHAGDSAGFGRNLRAVLPSLKVARPRLDGRQIREYVGIEPKVTF